MVGNTELRCSPAGILSSGRTARCLSHCEDNAVRDPNWLTYKGKSVPLQAWSGPEGSRKLRFPDFMTTAHEGGKVVSLKRRPHLPTGNFPGTHFC